MKRWMQFLVLITSISSAGALLASGGGGGEEGGRSKAMPAVANAKWKVECSGCHLLYHPALLPERSWTKMMNGLDKHFGENASLDGPTRDEIAAFLAANSADKQANRRSQRLMQSISANAAPLRISETDYFAARHDEISPSTFKRKSVGSAANCIACHKGAEQGDFSESQVKVPK